MANPQNSNCPRCNRVDMVQKVRALVEGGTVAGVYSSAFSNVPISGVTQSAKATQLLPGVAGLVSALD